MKNIENSSIVVQWDAVDDFLYTTYIVNWINESDHNLQSAILIEQSLYTITGLTLDTVYTITVTAANRCGIGPEFVASISFPADTTSTVSSISPNVTNPMTIMSTANSDAAATTTTTTTTDITSINADITSINTAITTISSNTIATTTTAQLSTTTTTAVKMDPSITTAISITTTVSRDTDTTSGTTKITSLRTTTSDENLSITVITDPITTTPTSINAATTANPADTTTTDDTSKFSSTHVVYNEY